MRKEDIRLVGQNISQPAIRYTSLQINSHQRRVSQRVTLLPYQAGRDVYLIASICVSVAASRYAGPRPTLRDCSDARPVNDLSESRPANGRRTHRARFPVSVQRKMLPSGQDLLRRQASCCEDFGALPNRRDLSVHGWVCRQYGVGFYRLTACCSDRIRDYANELVRCCINDR